MKSDPNAAAPPAGQFASVKDVDAQVKTRMDKAISDLQHEMAHIRTGRASLGILDNIRVDYYGTPTPLNQLANLHVPEPSLITLQPWDTSQIGAIEKAIRSSDLGLNPVRASNQGLEDMSLEAVESILIRKALTRCNGNVSQAAEALGLSRGALYRRMEKYGI